METHLKIAGIIMIILSLLHIVFPGYFKWKTEFAGLSLINRQMIYVHTFFIALVLLLMGLLCITSSSELITTKLGNRLMLGLGIFWTVRLFIQFFGYSSALWRGKKFETIIHIVFSVLWGYMSSIFIHTWSTT